MQVRATPVLGRKEKKGRVGVKLPEFDDFSVISRDSKISKLTVWFDKDQIYGIRAVYTLPDGSDVAGKEHLLVDQKDKVACQAIEIDADDRIAVVSGKYNNFIGYLRVATAKGVVHEFGDESGKNSVQPFLFDIETNETPAGLFGALDKASNNHLFDLLLIKKFVDENDYALAYLGFQITKVEARDEIKDETKH